MADSADTYQINSATRDNKNQTNQKDVLNRTKNDLAKVKNAGHSAELLGWLLFLVAGVAAFVGTANVGFFIYMLLGGLYFVYSGKYIRYGLGRSVKSKLLTNGIIGIIYSTGLIPIIVCVQSFINYSRFKKLPKRVQDIYSKPKPYKIMRHDIILGAIVVIVLVGGAYLGYWLRHHNPNVSNYASVSSQSSVYTASKYSFTIDFPGSPTATDSTLKVSGYNVPYTTYDSSIDNDTMEFDVYAYAWPTQDFNFSGLSKSNLQSAISDSLNGIVSGVKGTISSSNENTFSGYSAMEAIYTAPISGKNITGNIRVFFIGNNEYAINTLGASSTDFEKFANSFQYSGL